MKTEPPEEKVMRHRFWWEIPSLTELPSLERLFACRRGGDRVTSEALTLTSRNSGLAQQKMYKKFRFLATPQCDNAHPHTHTFAA